GQRHDHERPGARLLRSARGRLLRADRHVHDHRRQAGQQLSLVLLRQQHLPALREDAMRKIYCRLALVAVLCAASSADAKPRRLVVLDFDGQRAFADIGRTTVMSLLGDQYDVVATRRWETARAQASAHGPQQWQQAAKQAGVDAVIEGYVQDEGRHHVLTVVVREANTGRELDTVSIRLGTKGLDADQSRKLAKQLDDIFEWIDGDANMDVGSRLPDVRTARPMLGAHQPETKEREDDD